VSGWRSAAVRLAEANDVTISPLLNGFGLGILPVSFSQQGETNDMEAEARRLTDALFDDSAHLTKAEIIRRAVASRLEEWRVECLSRLPEGIVGRSETIRTMSDCSPPA
jgi:hypothetical protein